MRLLGNRRLRRLSQQESRPRFARSLSALAIASIWLVGCGSGSQFVEDGGGPGADAEDTDGGTDPIITPTDGGDVVTCVGLKCKVVQCGGGAHTTISGIVYDPAGQNPLYNIIAYVPNAPLPAITHGATCDKCGSVAASPVTTALTDVYGKFSLVDAPVGVNIPVVIQVGKWRKSITLPEVKQCQDNPVSKTLTRLPAKQSEGDMPKIALVGGCDPIHTLMQKIGIDPGEFTDENGKGAVHVFAGYGNQNGGVTTATDGYAFWGTKTKMMKYDMMINECECSPYPRDTKGPAYTNLYEYLNAGGRVFNSHYHANWFSDTAAATDFKNAATWNQWGSCNSPPNMIDQTFPKGKALSDWLWNIPFGKTATKGQVDPMSCAPIDVTKTLGKTQRWIYQQGGTQQPSYISFNTPTTKPPDQQCGRAVFADLHVGTGGTAMSAQEAALEFMLFDISACVSDDAVEPQPPPPN